MREIRPSGLAGGGAELNRLSLPRSLAQASSQAKAFRRVGLKHTQRAAMSTLPLLYCSVAGQTLTAPFRTSGQRAAARLPATAN